MKRLIRIGLFLLIVSVAITGFIFGFGDELNNGVVTPVQAEVVVDKPATYIIGQYDFTGSISNSAETDSGNASFLNVPYSVYSDRERVYVADGDNNRVLIYNGLPGEEGWDNSADYVLGQGDVFNTNTANKGGVSANSLNKPTSVYSDGNRVYVADFYNNRVLIYNGVPGEAGWDSSADYVLGQGDVFNTNTANKGGVSAISTSYPSSVYSDGSRVYVADVMNNRVLIYNGVPGEAGWDSSADYVLGQGDVFNTNTANKGGVSANSLYSPISVYSDGNRVYVADNNNNRVLIYNGVPGEAGWDSTADFVLGQGDVFNTNTANKGGVSAISTSYPNSVYSDGSRVYVVDKDNHRVLIYNGVPGEAGWDSTADFVLGQGDVFNTNTENKGGVSAISTSYPNSVYSDGTRVYFADTNNNRVLIYNGVPGEAGWDSSADYVLGQGDVFNTNTANNGGVSAVSLYNPRSTFIDGSRVYVVDTNNNRVLIYNGVPGEAGWDSSADYVLGQGDVFNTNTANNGGVSANSLYRPMSVYSDGNRVYVADLFNNRVLIYNGVPGEAGWDSSADYVLGQGDVFNTNTANKGGVSANSLNRPTSVYSDGDRVYVADNTNNRVLIYNGVPGQAGWDSTADFVLGQGDVFNTNTANKGGVSANSLNRPYSVYSDGEKVYVSDQMNNRVLIYNGVPGQAGWDGTADFVLGQGDVFNTNTANKGGLSAYSLNNPYSVYSDGSRVYVADVMNNRVLIYNGVPGQAGWDGTADFVLGQGDVFTTDTVNKGGVSANSLNSPNSVYSDGSRVSVADSNNNRVLIYKLSPQGITYQSSSYTQGVLPIILGSSDATDYLVKTTQTVEETDWKPFSTSHTWTFGEDEVDEEKTLWVKMRDYLDYESEWIEIKSILDRTKPILIPELKGEDEYTGKRDVLIVLNGYDNLAGLSEMLVCESSDFTGCDWESYANSRALTLSTGDGVKTIYVKVKDRAGNISEAAEDEIILDTTSPTLSIEFGSDYTATKEINISLSGEDNVSGLEKMQICESSDFTGCEWEAYSATKTLTLSTGDGVKTIYSKVKDGAGNISEIVQDTIILDTVNNKPIITQLGLIKNIPNKDKLYYYFNANRVRIYGTAESDSIVQFGRVNGTKYTTQADGSGNFFILIDLPNGEIKLTYSSTDLAGNVSGSRKITLNIDPSYGTRAEEATQEIVTTDEEEVAEEEATTQTEQEETEQETTPVVKSLLVVDSSGNILSNKTIVIEGKEYKTDDRGYIHTDQGFTSDLIASIEGRNYTIKPSSTYLTLTEAQEEGKKFNYLYLTIPIIIFITLIIFLLKKKSYDLHS